MVSKYYNVGKYSIANFAYFVYICITCRHFGVFWLKNGLDNLVPRALIRVEHEAEGPGKGWLSHDQIFQYIWKIFLANYRVLNFFDKFSKYIEKFGHVTTSICQGLCRHIFHHKEERG